MRVDAPGWRVVVSEEIGENGTAVHTAERFGSKSCEFRGGGGTCVEGEHRSSRADVEPILDQYLRVRQSVSIFRD